jgi:hypothetical protein
MTDLDGLWQQELLRVVAHAFTRTDARLAVDRVRRVRDGTADINEWPDPSGGKTGGVYNALNQLMVAGSLNHMLFTSSPLDSQHFPGRKENWWQVRDEYRDIIELAVAGQDHPLPTGCARQAALVDRMPAAPDYSQEREYFDYVGAPVIPLAEAQAQVEAAAAPAVEYGGEVVFLLSEGQHFIRIDDQHIVGPVHSLCVLAEERRVIVSDNLDRTYMVEHKELAGNQVTVRLRQARPIIDRDYVAGLFSGGAGV